MFDEKTLKWFDYHGIQRPLHLPHGIKDTPQNPLSEQMPKLKCSNWRLEGTWLMCDTDAGPFTQNIKRTDLVCRGTDENGMPILTKITT